MPTVMTHALVGVGLGRLFTSRRAGGLFWGLAAILPMVPDLDFVAFYLGIRYEEPLGHRGFSHSLLFALGLGLAAAALTYRRLGFRLLDLGGFFFAVAASHGILDACTNGGLGVAFFWPWTNERYFLPWRAIEVSPIGLGFFSSQGLNVLWSEVSWVWLPMAAVVGAVELGRALRRRAKPVAPK